MGGLGKFFSNEAVYKLGEIQYFLILKTIEDIKYNNIIFAIFKRICQGQMADAHEHKASTKIHCSKKVLQFVFKTDFVCFHNINPMTIKSLLNEIKY